MSWSDDHDDWLTDIYYVGVILLITPILLLIAVATYSMLNPRTSIAVEGGVYATGSMVSGLIIMLYALIKIARKEHTRSK